MLFEWYSSFPVQAYTGSTRQGVSRPTIPTNARYRPMTTTRITIEPGTASLTGRIDIARVDATTEAEIARHMAVDEHQAMQDAAQFAR